MDCSKTCTKDHNLHPEPGDIHHEFDSEGNLTGTLVFHSSAWSKIPVGGAISSSSGVHMHSTPHRGIDMTTTTTTGTSGSFSTSIRMPDRIRKIGRPKVEKLPARRDFVAIELNDHVQINMGTCECGYVVEDSMSYALHIARVAVDASDKWDIEIMKDDNEEI